LKGGEKRAKIPIVGYSFIFAYNLLKKGRKKSKRKKQKQQEETKGEREREGEREKG
jgi:hypothetical protein